MKNKTTQQNMVKEVTASARYLRLSPRKARLVTNLVKEMYATDAIAQLQFVNKKAAEMVRDVIKSAVANGENNFKMKREDLFIKSITCDAGPKLKRYMPRAQGRATEIRRPLAHINVTLIEKPSNKKRRFAAETEQSKAQRVKKETAKKTAKQDAAEEKNNPAMRGQVEKTQQDSKKNTVQQKRRLFNRKSGV